jgi:hypothetical protein
MKPRICPLCTAALARPTRHAAKRYCSQVQAQARYRASEKGRKANREAQREHRRQSRRA